MREKMTKIREYVNEYEEPVMAVTEKETDKKCPACGGVMDYNPQNGKLKCPYCDTEVEIKVENKTFVAKEMDFASVEDEGSCDWGTATKTIICKACGAQTVYDVNQIAHECPYCGSNQVMEETQEKILAPGGVVLFQITAKEASDRFKRWIGRKFFCPKLAKESAKPKALKGLYIPFWTYDADTYSNYTGEYGKDRRVKNSEGKEVIVTDWYRTSGSYKDTFDDVLVCASTKQDTYMLSGLEPFDTNKAVEYKPEYMAGFIAERYTIRMKDAWETAKMKIHHILTEKIEDKIEREHHTHQSRNIMFQTRYSNETCKYLLLPVWISSFQYKGKVYRFMINGQTGKVSGQTPISWVKVAIVVAAAAAAAALIYYMGQDSYETMRETRNLYEWIKM